jgi:CheY-like chemotaxis protein
VGRPIRVLFVEDSADDVQLVTRYLTRAGYEAMVERVESSGELQAALERSQWDLVMADYMVPGFSGPAAVALLNNRPGAPPVVIVSGAVGDEIMGMQVLLSGARDYLAKTYLARLVPAIGLAAGVIPEQERPDAHLALCQVYMSLPEPNLPKAVHHGEQALTGAEALGQGELYAHAALTLATCFVRMGWAGDAVRVLRRYLGVPAPLALLEGEVNYQLGLALHQLGDVAASGEALVRARDWFAARNLDHLAAQAEAELAELATEEETTEPDLSESDDPFVGHRVRGEYFLLRNNPAMAVREGLAALGLAGQDPVRTFYSYSLLMRGARVRGHHKEAMAFAVSGRLAALDAGRFDLAFQATQSFGEMYLSLGAEAAQILQELEQEYQANGVDAAQIIGPLRELVDGRAW